MSSFKSQLEFIYFDFDNVLAFRKESRSARVAMDLGVDQQALREFYRNGYMNNPQYVAAYYQLESIDDEIFFYADLFADFSGVSKSHARDVADWFVHLGFNYDQNAIDTVREVAEHYRVGVLSNGKPSRKQEISDAGLDDILEQTLVSYDIGARKPEPRVYDIAAYVADLPKNVIGLVDDNVANNAGALAAGFGWANTKPDELLA